MRSFCWGNCARTIEYASFFLLAKEMLKNYIYSSLNKTNKQLVAQLSINCLIVSIDKEEFHNSEFLITEITKLLDNELSYYERTIFLYARGYFEFETNIDTGIEKMKQAIQVFEILGEENLKTQYIEHYTKHVKMN